MRKLISLAILAGCLTGCDELGRQAQPTQSQTKQQPTTQSLAADERPDPPKPSSLPGEKWEVYTVNSYRSMKPTYSYNPFDKRTETWLEYRMTLEGKTRVRLTLTCGQWRLPDASEGCGQGVLVPNEKVWTRQGVSGEQIWVYCNEHPKNGLTATFWHVESRDAE